MSYGNPFTTIFDQSLSVKIVDFVKQKLTTICWAIVNLINGFLITIYDTMIIFFVKLNKLCNKSPFQLITFSPKPINPQEKDQISLCRRCERYKNYCNNGDRLCFAFSFIPIPCNGSNWFVLNNSVTSSMYAKKIHIEVLRNG